MNGQWVGRYTGTNSGLLVIDLDDIGTHYEGIACAYDDDTSLPSTCVFIKTTDKSNPFNGRVDLLLIDPRSGEPTTWDKISSLFESDTIVPEYADVRLDLSGDTLNVTWETNINTSGYAEIARTKADTPTEYQPLPEVKSWEQFKVY